MVILDALPRPSTCYQIPLRPLRSPVVSYTSVERAHTSSGFLPNVYQDSLIEISFDAEAETELDNSYLRALSLEAEAEMTCINTDQPIVEPVSPTRALAAGLPVSFGLSVVYYPVFLGVIGAVEIESVRGCNRSLWEIKLTETRKIKPSVRSWDGNLSPELGLVTVVASDGVFNLAPGETNPPPNPLRSWYRKIATDEFNVVSFDTGVIWSA